MKKTIVSIVLLLTVLVTAQTALGNSGPTRWASYPHAEALAIEKNCPITIQQEDLLFDLTQGSQYSYTVNGRITATYSMHNPTGQTQTVQMAFPFINTLRAFDPSSVRITADDAALEYTTHIGRQVAQNQYEEADSSPYSFESILHSLRQEVYTPEKFSLQAAALYRFQFNKIGAEEVSVELRYAPSNTNTLFLGDGFHGFGSYEDGSVMFTARTGYTASVLVIGEDIPYTMQGFADGRQDSPSDTYTVSVQRQDVLVSDYIREVTTSLAREALPTAYAQNENLLDQVYNLSLKVLDRSFQYGNSTTAYDIRNAFEASYLQAFVYTVEFAPGQTREVFVSYPASGSMDRSKTSEPLHYFTYLLSPASHWASFGELNITVLTPQEAPYLLNSSLPFTAQGERRFTAHSGGLPGETLTFTLYANEDISVLDRAAGAMRNTFGYMAPVVSGLLVLAVLLALAALLGHKRKQKRKDGESA